MNIIDQPKGFPMGPPESPPPPPPYEEFSAVQDHQHQRRGNSSINDMNTNALEIATPPVPGAIDHRELEEPICCCGFEIRSGVRAIGIIDVIRLIIISALLMWYASYLSVDEDMVLVIILSIVACFIAIHAVTLAMLFYGISAERPGYLIPYMVWQIIDIIGGVLLGAAQVYGGNGAGLGRVAGSLIGIYFLVQVKKCRQFLKLKSQRRQLLIGA